MRPDITKRIKVFFISAGVFLVLAAIADHLALPFLVSDTASKGILFPPGSEFPYQTPEFSHKAKINSLGFRDREWEVQKKGPATRVLAIGDSFTFGMGVELEKTWPKVLEQKLLNNGFAVEIANLGRPGAHPASYVQTAQKAIPLLKPDIIIVAILQGDDLAQTIKQIMAEHSENKNSLFHHLSLRLTQTVQYLYPNFSRAVQGHLTNRSTFRSKERLLENIWKEQAERLAGGYSGEKKARFDAMGDTARDMFLNGHLNPGIVSMAIADPEHFVTPLRTENQIVKTALQKMQKHLLSIKKAAGDAEVIVLSIPLGLYVNENVREAQKEIGFTILPEMLVTTKPDDSLKKICDEIAIPVFSATQVFRRKHLAEPLYYTYDGHFTARGHELYAEHILPDIQKHADEKKTAEAHYDKH